MATNWGKGDRGRAWQTHQVNWCKGFGWMFGSGGNEMGYVTIQDVLMKPCT